MMRLLLGSLINTIPEERGLADPITARLPPLTVTPDGPEIDYSLLLMAETLVVDRTSLDFLETHSDPHVRNVGNSIRTLYAEGFADISDFCALLEGETGIETAALQAARDPEYWLDGIRKHVLKYRDLRPTFDNYFGNHMQPWDRQIFSIANYYAKRNGGLVSELGSARLANMILQKQPSNMSPGELEATRALIFESIQGVGGQAVVAHKTNSHCYSWNTFDHMFGMLANYSPVKSDSIEKNVQACQDFFRLAYPVFRPKSQSDWLRLLTHKNIYRLRERIAEAVNSGDNIDAKFAARQYEELLKSDGEISKRRTFVGRGVAGLGLAAGAVTDYFTTGLPIISSILAGTGAGVAGILTQEATDKFISSDDRFKWMYFTSIK